MICLNSYASNIDLSVVHSSIINGSLTYSQTYGHGVFVHLVLNILKESRLVETYNATAYIQAECWMSI